LLLSAQHFFSILTSTDTLRKNKKLARNIHAKAQSLSYQFRTTTSSARGLVELRRPLNGIGHRTLLTQNSQQLRTPVVSLFLTSPTTFYPLLCKPTLHNLSHRSQWRTLWTILAPAARGSNGSPSSTPSTSRPRTTAELLSSAPLVCSAPSRSFTELFRARPELPRAEWLIMNLVGPKTNSAEKINMLRKGPSSPVIFL